ncbi:lysozyme family protein [Ornithinibacillus californiensis]|uniref:lysozyme family protein n=1 Tax=Ornithinibacillus californiensis TaxID=161536 RepID=UPI00064D88CC|nr:lysozyme family protein [Ornithinibacillus californiensis]
MKKQTKKALKQTFYLAIGLVGIFLVFSLLVEEQELTVSKDVLQYKPLVEKYAEEYGIAGHVDVLLAMMMQESGGRGTDPMQSSESFCGQVGCIDDPNLSIKQGVYYFSETLKEAGYDVELAIQSYNFGKGFIDYVHETTGQYTQEAAIAFSQKMYENATDKSIYSCLREEAKQYNACYGDIYYVQAVMGYLEEIKASQ